MRKALVIGLDCAAPDLLFNKFRNKLPNFNKIMQKGIYGTLESCDPPITIPAWAVMTSGKDPGTLGAYGFRHRKNNSYNDIWITTSNHIKEKRIWDYVSLAGGKSCIVGVPPSYPPFKIDGWLVGDFMSPTTENKFTYPESFKNEIKGIVPDYVTDVEFRIDDKRNLAKDIFDMTEKHFRVIKYLLQTKDWRFFMFVEIGLDRIHHAFWRYFDKTHHLYEPGNEFENLIEEYYVMLDRELGEILELLDDDTVVLVASDHGGKPMKGIFCINQWLIEQGYLKLKKPVKHISSFMNVEVDWERTTAWGWGGYYSRIFINVKGREPCGIIDPGQFEEKRNEIMRKILSIKGPGGEGWGTKVLKPEEVYKECKGDSPDLMVYLDNLNWRSVGTIGHDVLYLKENDTGPDDAVHDKMGAYIFYDPKENYNGQMTKMNILDVMPTLLKSMKLVIPEDIMGIPNSVLT